MHQDLLYTIAEVAVTLAGFSGVVFILGSRSQGQFSVSEKNGLFHLLFTTCGNMLVVLIVAACIEFSVEKLTAWRIGCFLMALFVVVGALKAISEERQGEHSLPKPLAWPIPVVAMILASANLLIAAGIAVGHAPVACISLSIYLLFVAVCYFASLLVPVAEDKK